MRIRRCAIVLFEPRESLAFDFETLLEGGDGLARTQALVAMAPHLEAEVRVSADEIGLLGTISPSEWIEFDAAVVSPRTDMILRLIAAGLLVAESTDDSAAPTREQQVRDTHWRPLSAAAHYSSRWQGVSAGEEAHQAGYESMQDLSEKLGAPPPAVHEWVDREQRIALPSGLRTELDQLLETRVTCRNFDPTASLSIETLAGALRRTFGALARVEIEPGTEVLKKSSPSGGGLHPIGAYLIAQRVVGLAPGLYHYHPVDHALEPISALTTAQTSELALRAVAGQRYFADAPVLIALVCRFQRNFWKYRNHAKAYRVVILDAGHLSQTLYLAATDAGLGAFITAAVNEIDIEQAFGLDPLVESPLAVCGIGIRTSVRESPEFDPNHKVWP